MEGFLTGSDDTTPWRWDTHGRLLQFPVQGLGRRICKHANIPFQRPNAILIAKGGDDFNHAMKEGRILCMTWTTPKQSRTLSNSVTLFSKIPNRRTVRKRYHRCTGKALAEEGLLANDVKKKLGGPSIHTPDTVTVQTTQDHICTYRGWTPIISDNVLISEQRMGILNTLFPMAIESVEEAVNWLQN